MPHLRSIILLYTDERQSESAAILRSIGRRVAGEMGAGNRNSGTYAFTSPRSDSGASKRSESSADGASTSSRDDAAALGAVTLSGVEEGAIGGGVLNGLNGSAGRSGANNQRWRRVPPGHNGSSRTETDAELRALFLGSPNRNGNRSGWKWIFLSGWVWICVCVCAYLCLRLCESVLVSLKLVCKCVRAF